MGQHEPGRRHGDDAIVARRGAVRDGDGDDRHRRGDDDVEHRPNLDVAAVGDEQGAGEAGDEGGDSERGDRQTVAESRTVCRRAANQPDSWSVTIAIAAPSESR